MKLLNFRKYQTPCVAYAPLEAESVLCSSITISPVYVDETENVTGTDPAGSYFDNF